MTKQIEQEIAIWSLKKYSVIADFHLTGKSIEIPRIGPNSSG